MKNEMTKRERERGGSLFRYPFKNWVVKLLEVGFLRRRERRSFERARERLLTFLRFFVCMRTVINTGFRRKTIISSKSTRS